MATWSDIFGTTVGYLRLGLTGVRLKNSAGVLAVRNAGDSADAETTCSKITTSVAQSWSVAQRGAFTALTSSSASIAVNLALSNNFNHTMTENTTLAAPSNAVAGQSGLIEITQHASAAKTLAYNSFWKFTVATPALSTATGARQILYYTVNSSGSDATCVLGDRLL